MTDVYVTFRRSLDPSLTLGRALLVQWPPVISSTCRMCTFQPWSKRRRPRPALRVPQASARTPHFITVGADIVQAGGNQTVQVPVRVLAADSLPIRVLMLNVEVDPAGRLSRRYQYRCFLPRRRFGDACLTMSQSANNYAAAWLNSSNSGVSGTNVIGTVTVTLPPNVTANSSYLVHFEHFSASPNGLALFHSTVHGRLDYRRQSQRFQLERRHPRLLAACFGSAPFPMRSPPPMPIPTATALPTGRNMWPEQIPTTRLCFSVSAGHFIRPVELHPAMVLCRQ